MTTTQYSPQQRRKTRKRQRRQKRLRILLLILVLAGILYGAWRYLKPTDYYTAQHFGIKTLKSSVDQDSDGIDDYKDLMKGARDYIATNPHYESKYYDTGYPNDGCGVCTDVIWQAFKAAGYDLRGLVDADIAAHRECYPNITTPDSNIDFRRVNTLNHFFSRYAESLTTDFDDPAQWQPGDIVIFGDSEHIAICSDKRNADGIPWIIHHGNPRDEAVEADQIGRMAVSAHYRWNGLT